MDAVIGGLLAILIIFLFLRDGWSTFVIGLSLPVSIIATFFFMGQLGLSLNVMSLGGLALATGLVVDDSIVVLESHRQGARARAGHPGGGDRRHPRSQHGRGRLDPDHHRGVPAAGVRARASPAQLFRDQALTVAIAIAVSLVVAMTLIPMLSCAQGPPAAGVPGRSRRIRSWQPDEALAEAGRRGRPRCRCAASAALFFGVAWVVIRVWRGVVAVVGPVMRKASDLAMTPYAPRRTRLHARCCPARCSVRGRCWALPRLAFAADHGRWCRCWAPT